MRNMAQAFLLWAITKTYKGADNMAIATIYVTLIIEGDKTYAQVPNKIKPEVKRQLELLGYGDLAV